LRVSIPPRDENSFVCFPTLVPKYGHTMRSVLTTKTDNGRQSLRTDMFQADQADSGYGKALMQLRPEARRKLILHHLPIDTKVSKDSPADDSLNSR